MLKAVTFEISKVSVLNETWYSGSVELNGSVVKRNICNDQTTILALF